jgi:hypothetical protein
MQSENQISIADKVIAATNAIDEKSSGGLRDQLIFLINELINNDFNALVQILYRIDVDEKKLKQLLKESKDSDTASIIADLIVERQLQKIKSKSWFSRHEKPDTGES